MIYSSSSIPSTVLIPHENFSYSLAFFMGWYNDREDLNVWRPCNFSHGMFNIPKFRKLDHISTSKGNQDYEIITIITPFCFNIKLPVTNYCGFPVFLAFSTPGSTVICCLASWRRSASSTPGAPPHWRATKWEDPSAPTSRFGSVPWPSLALLRCLHRCFFAGEKRQKHRLVGFLRRIGFRGIWNDLEEKPRFRIGRKLFAARVACRGMRGHWKTFAYMFQVNIVFRFAFAFPSCICLNQCLGSTERPNRRAVEGECRQPELHEAQLWAEHPDPPMVLVEAGTHRDLPHPWDAQRSLCCSFGISFFFNFLSKERALLNRTHHEVSGRMMGLER